MERKHRMRLAGAAVLLVLLVALGTWAAGGREDAAVEAGSWGLSFRTEGECPTGNATPEALAQYGAAFVGDGKEPVIYLTFDAGYENGNTGKILDVLKAQQVPAAFFVVGSFVEQNPDLVRRMAEEGHIVGNHTWHHWDMSRISDEAVFTEELRSLEKLYEQVTGSPMPKFYRPPQGIYSEENLRLAQKLGYHTVFWSLAYVDWYQDDQPTSEEAFSKLIPRIHNGAVVLLHSTSTTNAAILDDLLTRWKEMGYRFGRLEELFADQSGTAG